MTKRTLAIVQRRHGTTLIARHLPERKPPVGSGMTSWHVTTDYQRHTPAKSSKVYPGSSVIYFFKIDKVCKEIFAILPRFFEDWHQSEDLVRGAATRTKTALVILQS